MIPSKRPLGSRPLPSTSLPKAALAKAALAKAALAKTAPAKTAVAKPVAKTAVGKPVAAKPSLAPAAFVAGATLPSASLAKGTLANGTLAKGALAKGRLVRVSSGKFNLKDRSKKFWALAVTLFLLLSGGIGWAFGLIGPRPSFRAQMASIDKQLQNPDLTKDDREALEGEQFKLLMNKGRLPRGFSDDGSSGFGGGRGGMRGDQLKAFMAMSPADQTKELDKRIDDILAWQKKREAQDAANKDSASAGKDGSGRGGRGGDGGGGRGGRGPRDPNGPSNSWRNRMLSSTPADSRAQRGMNRQVQKAFGEMMQNRATQRGVTLPSFGRG